MDIRSFIAICCFSRCQFNRLSRIKQSNILCPCFFCFSDHQTFRGLFFHDLIFTEIQFRSCCAAVCSGFNPGDQIAFLMDLGFLILAVDIFCRIHSIFCSCIGSILIHKTQVSFLTGYSCKDFSCFVDSDLSLLFFIGDSHRCCTSCLQLHIVRRSIQLISLWNRDFFQIHGILCFRKLYLRCAICVRFRHFPNEVCAAFIRINTKNCAGKINS